jgi:hypothetical protein
MPKKDKATLEFTAIEKQFRMPFVIYADFECLLTPEECFSTHRASSATDQSRSPPILEDYRSI